MTIYIYIYIYIIKLFQTSLSIFDYFQISNYFISACDVPFVDLPGISYVR